MNAAVYIPAMGMWASLSGLVILGLVGGFILYLCEKQAENHRSEH